MMIKGSCKGCKYLASNGEGYSNYTWEDTVVACLLNKNPNLPSSEPWDWSMDHVPVQETDRWHATNDSQCGSYEEGDQVAIDVEGEDSPEDCTSDEEVLRLAHAKYDPIYDYVWKTDEPTP